MESSQPSSRADLLKDEYEDFRNAYITLTNLRYKAIAGEQIDTEYLSHEIGRLRELITKAVSRARNPVLTPFYKSHENVLHNVETYAGKIPEYIQQIITAVYLQRTGVKQEDIAPRKNRAVEAIDYMISYLAKLRDDAHTGYTRRELNFVQIGAIIVASSYIGYLLFFGKSTTAKLVTPEFTTTSLIFSILLIILALIMMSRKKSSKNQNIKS